MLHFLSTLIRRFLLQSFRVVTQNASLESKRLFYIVNHPIVSVRQIWNDYFDLGKSPPPMVSTNIATIITSSTTTIT